MSQEYADLIHRAETAVNRRDLDALLDLCDPDLELVPRLRQVEGGSYRGHDGVRTWWADLFAVFPDFKLAYDQIRGLGDSTVVRARMSGQGTLSDAPTEQTSWMVIEWRGRKASRWRVFASETEALEAAGLRE